MEIIEFLEKYSKQTYKNIHTTLFYNRKGNTKHSWWNEKTDGVFHPYYSFSGDKISYGFEEFKDLFNSVDLTKYHNVKFVLGDCTFYTYTGTFTEKDNIKTEFGIYLDLYGYRDVVLKLERTNYDDYKNYWLGIEGIDIIFDLLKSDNIKLDKYDEKELIGEMPFIPRKYGVIPSKYRNSTKVKYKFSDDNVSYEKDAVIDFDKFIIMNNVNGIYTPSKLVTHGIVNSYDDKDYILPRVKKIKDLGVKVIRLLNDSNYDISLFYDLEGVEVKASKKVLGMYPNLRKYSKDEKKKAEIEAKEEAERKAEEKEIYDDTFTLMQHGKIILKDVRSYKISEYFENRTANEFESNLIELGKKCFDCIKGISDIKKIFFGSYGIYTYTELAGEKFANFDDIESVNKCKGIEIPARLVTLFHLDSFGFPCIDTGSDDIVFDRGATYLGVEKNEDGEIVVIYEDGDQNI